MSQTTAYSGARIFDGEAWHDDAALVVEGGVVNPLEPRRLARRVSFSMAGCWQRG